MTGGIIDEQLKQIFLLHYWFSFSNVYYYFPSLLLSNRTNRFCDRWSTRSFNHECNSNPSHRSTERTRVLHLGSQRYNERERPLWKCLIFYSFKHWRFFLFFFLIKRATRWKRRWRIFSGFPRNLHVNSRAFVQFNFVKKFIGWLKPRVSNNGNRYSWRFRECNKLQFVRSC